MKRIALISDSHSHIDENVIRHLSGVDEIWHAGDIGDTRILESLPPGKSTRIITGNIDDHHARDLYPDHLLFETEGLKVLMVHIGGKPPRYTNDIKEQIALSRPGIFACGHSHICRVEYDQKLDCLYMNPGAIGQHGFHVMRTLLLFEIEEGKVKNLRVVELGKRGK